MRRVPGFKRPYSRFLKKFAVCDIPLDHICDYNVSKEWCHGLGCCFRKEYCYEKSVPTPPVDKGVLVSCGLGGFLFFLLYVLFCRAPSGTRQRVCLLTPDTGRPRKSDTWVTDECYRPWPPGLPDPTASISTPALVGTYVKVFFALIALVAVAFIIAIIYRATVTIIDCDETEDFDAW